MKMLSLALLMAVSPLALFAQMAAFQSVTPAQAIDLVEAGAIFVDVREADEVAELAYDLDEVTALPLSELEARMKELPTDAKLIMACQAGGRSARAIALLQKNGYTDLVNLEGGMNAWRAAGQSTLDADQQIAAMKASCACCSGGSEPCYLGKACCMGADGKPKACCGSGGCSMLSETKATTGKKACCAGSAKSCAKGS